ncbi:autism susceptibility gene 2 protein homolog [Alligator sinensis]|uniref:Autism susceptibility gene 2 protein homolog n=1 Tax=Alligator sinensis TaxID=38654 RepID=A0A3Q0FRK4_ALLSI|nr:autism susceptibility gene 2 protein homolog [Alligator sinensis]
MLWGWSLGKRGRSYLLPRSGAGKERAVAYGPAHDPWSRLHRTPPSFPTAPAWPKAAGDGPDRPHDKEPEKREVPAIKDEKDRDTIFSRHPLRASPAPPKPPAALAHEEAAAGRTELGRELRYGSPAGGGAARSPYLQAQLKKEVKAPPSASPAPPPGATAGLLSAPPPLIPAAATPTARSASPRRPPDVRDLAAAYKDRESR